MSSDSHNPPAPPAIMPSGPLRRRWLRFSLRSLLVVVSAVGVWLGLVVHRAETQRQVVCAIEAAGGIVWYEDDPNAGGLFRRWQFRSTSERPDRWIRDYLHSVTEIDLTGTPCGDALIAQLVGARTIEKCVLDHTRVSDEALQSLSQLTGLRYLSLAGTSISDAGLAHLSKSKELAVLVLNDTQVTDAGLNHVKHLPQLKMITVSGSRVTERGINALIEADPDQAAYGL